jgi:hypothetical protein
MAIMFCRILLSISLSSSPFSSGMALNPDYKVLMLLL